VLMLVLTVLVPTVLTLVLTVLVLPVRGVLMVRAYG
jgi:hypothetical protein